MRYAILITCLLSLGAKPHYGVPKQIDYLCASAPARATVIIEPALPRAGVVPPPAVVRAPVTLPSYVMPSYTQRAQQIIQKAQAYQSGPRGQAYQNVIPAQWIANRHRSCTGGL
jgi:hypothetical protein